LTEAHFTELVEALKLLGIAIARAGVYGVDHPAAQEASADAFAALDPLLRVRERPLELSTESGELLLDGEAAGYEPALSGLLVPQLSRHGRLVLVLSSPLAQAELSELIELLAQPPQSRFQSGPTLADQMMESGWKTIRPVKGHYARITDDQSAGDGAGGGGKGGGTSGGGTSGGADGRGAESGAAPRGKGRGDGGSGGSGPQVMDLTGELAAQLAAGLLDRTTGDETRAMADFGGHVRLNHLLDRLENIAIRFDADDNTIAPEGRRLIQTLLLEMQQIALTISTRITNIAADAAADRPIVRRLEQDAIRRGIHLRATRDELLAELAELHQELLQPLTVVSGVLETILSGLLGETTEPQHSMLQLAFDSVNTVSEIARHVTELVGYPAGLTPKPPTF